MNANFSVKDLVGKATIDGKTFSNTEFFMSLRYSNEIGYHLSIMAPNGEKVSRNRIERNWYYVEMEENPLNSPHLKKPNLNTKSEHTGSLKYEYGIGAEVETQWRYFMDTKLIFGKNDNGRSILTASGKTMAEHKDGKAAWEYEISVEINDAVATIIEALPKCTDSNIA